MNCFGNTIKVLSEPVSLILTTLNEEASLSEFRDSLLGQSMLPDELVICDGGSSDDTVSILRSWELPGVGIRVVVEKGAGIARGRNIAIEHAKNDLIAVTDAGCRLESDWLRNITRPFAENKPVFVVGGGYGIEARSRFERIVKAAELSIDKIPPKDFLPSSRSFALRKSAWSAVSGYPEHLSFAGEDTDFCLRLREAGYEIVLALDAVVHWHPRPTLRKFVRQHMLYGIGDGEAGNKGPYYAKVFLKHVLLWSPAIAGFIHTTAPALLCVSFPAYFIKLFLLYSWNTVPATRALAAFVLVGIKEISSLTGYLRGSWRRLVARKTE